MKRLIIACQIVAVALFIVKILFLTEALQMTSLLSTLSLDHVGQAMAQTTAKVGAAAVRDVTDDGLREERDLLTLLQKRQKELDSRESSIKADEERLVALKKEIMEKIDALKLLETQLSAKLDAENANDMKRMKELAKVYEASPPQKAAAMLDKLEIKTAAGITINMKRERAGQILGYLTPQKAVEITNEIAKTKR